MARTTKKAQAKKKAKAKTQAKQPKERAVILRRNAAPSRTRSPDIIQLETSHAQDGDRRPLTRRVEDMGGSHMAAAVAGGSLGNVAGVVCTAQGWIGPKWAAGTLMGAGLTTSVAGWYWDSDHAMATGAGIAAAGAFSMVNQLAIDTYEAIEKKAEEKRARKEAEEREKRLAEARALLAAQATNKSPRNARRIVVLDPDGEPIDGYPQDVPEAA